MWQLSGCLLFLPISELIYFGIYETCCTQYLKLWKEPALYWSQFTSALCCYFLIYFYTVSHLLILFICMPKRKERERGRERITLQRIVAQRLSATILSQTLAPSFCFLCQPSLCCILHPALLQKLFLTLSWVSPTFCSLKLFCGTISTSITEKKLLLLWRLKIFLRLKIFQEDCQEHGSIEQNWPAKQLLVFSYFSILQMGSGFAAQLRGVCIAGHFYPSILLQDFPNSLFLTLFITMHLELIVSSCDQP